MQWETSHPRDYLHAIRTNVPIELEALSYHSCPIVRVKAAVKTTRLHVVERLLRDRDPRVVVNALDNPICTTELVELVGIWMCSGSGYEAMVWYMVKVHRLAPWWLKDLMEVRERARTALIREECKLPPQTQKTYAPPPETLSEKRKIELDCLRLRQPRSTTERWGVITLRGWADYSTHECSHVRFLVVRHKDCPVWVLYNLADDPSALVRLHARVRLACKGKKFKQ